MNRDAASGCAAPAWVTHQRVTPASSITQLRSHHPQARGEKPGTKHTYSKFTVCLFFHRSIPTLCVCVCPIWPFAEYWNRRKCLMEGSQRGSASHVAWILCRGCAASSAVTSIYDDLNPQLLKLEESPPPFLGDISMRAPDGRPAHRLPSACPSVPCVRFCGRTLPVAAAFNAASSWRASLMENLPPLPPPPKNLFTTQPVFFRDCLINMWLRVKPQRWIDWLKVEYVESFSSHVLLPSVCFLSELGSFVEDRLEVIHRVHTSLPTVGTKKSGHRHRWPASQPPTRRGRQPLHCCRD